MVSFFLSFLVTITIPRKPRELHAVGLLNRKWSRAVLLVPANPSDLGPLPGPIPNLVIKGAVYFNTLYIHP